MFFEVSGITDNEMGMVWTISLSCRFILYLGNAVPTGMGFREIRGKGLCFEAEDPGHGASAMQLICSETALVQGFAEL